MRASCSLPHLVQDDAERAHRWKWGATGRPSGKIAEISEEGSVEVTSNKVRILFSTTRASLSAHSDSAAQGNTVKRNGRGPEDPAVKITRKGVGGLLFF